MQKNTLTSKVALITGAGRRIGAEIARFLHAAEINVVLHYHASEHDAERLLNELNQKRAHSAFLVKGELTEIAQLKDIVQTASEAWGRLDILVNNASRFYKTFIGKVTEPEWDDLLTANLKAPFFLAEAATPYLAKTKGVIINITDIHAERPLPHYGIYCLSKSGLLTLTKILAKELAPDIRVNAVAPGAILWPEGENTLSLKEQEEVIQRTLLKRVGEASDIAKAVLFLVADGSYVTGQVLNVDGGRILVE